MNTKRFLNNAIRILLLASALASVALLVPSLALADGAGQISGIGEFADPGECDDPAGAGSDFAFILDGDLEGCVYVSVTGSVYTPSGTYREWGTELYVVSHNGEIGSFETTYKFEGKFLDPENFIGEIFGRCQHPIVAGSGTGAFMGVTGRLDYKDDVVLGNFPYRGHLSYP